jgi:hypothetical protein
LNPYDPRLRAQGDFSAAINLAEGFSHRQSSLMKSAHKRFNFDAFQESFEQYRVKAFRATCQMEEENYGDPLEAIQTEHNLEWNLRMMYLRLLFGIETFGYGEFTKALVDGFKAFEGSLNKLTYVDDFDLYYSPAYSHLTSFYEVFCLLAKDVKTDTNRADRERLQLMLQGTPKMIFDRGAQPKDEKDVQKIVRETLSHYFPDLVAEVPIPKTFKTYRPDFGIPSLKTAIEYKFVDSGKDWKTCLGGIFEDSKGYHGTQDWRYFIAVIYITKAFCTPAQLQAEMERAGMPSNWTIFTVTGDGKRQEKTPPQKPEAR